MALVDSQRPSADALDQFSIVRPTQAVEPAECRNGGEMQTFSPDAK